MASLHALADTMTQAAAVERRKGITWALMGALGGAVFVIPWKLASEVGQPAHSALILLFSAAIANTAFVAWQRISSQRSNFRIARVELAVAVLLATFTLFGNLASARAIQVLSPALLNVLLRTEVLIIATLAWLLLGERVERRFWIGAAIAALGLVVLQGPLDAIRSQGLFGVGTGMALLAAACFSSLSVLTRYFIHRIDPVMVNALRLWLAVALWFVFNSRPDFSNLPSEQIAYAGLAALAGPFFARLCLMISARHVEARVTALANLTTPAMTLLFAFVLLSDWPQTHQLIGGAIMISGIAIPMLRRRRR